MCVRMWIHWAGNMAQHVEAFAARSDHLHLIRRTQQMILWLPRVYCDMHTPHTIHLMQTDIHIHHAYPMHMHSIYTSSVPYTHVSHPSPSLCHTHIYTHRHIHTHTLTPCTSYPYLSHTHTHSHTHIVHSLNTSITHMCMHTHTLTPWTPDIHLYLTHTYTLTSCIPHTHVSHTHTLCTPHIQA